MSKHPVEDVNCLEPRPSGPLRGCVWSIWIPSDQKRGVWRRRVPCGCGGEGDITLVLLDLVVGGMLPRNVDHGARAGGKCLRCKRVVGRMRTETNRRERGQTRF